MTPIQIVTRLLEQAERTRLYGEIVLRFRDGRLTFVVEEKTTPVAEELNDRRDR